MKLVEKFSLAVLYRLDPERAQRIALRALKVGLAPTGRRYTSRRLETELAGLKLSNPLGLAAGFDKNAEAIGGLSKIGFGFIEFGTVTPLPQEGNPRPRLFRLKDERAVINRFGFNSDGMEKVGPRLEFGASDCVIGVNIGPNRDSPDVAADYAAVLEACGTVIDYATINVSSPNTAGLRSMQGAKPLADILAAVTGIRNGLANRPPIMLKVAPDVAERQIEEICATAVAGGVDGIIATNTTVERCGLSSQAAAEKGGLSGRPLFELSTRVLRQFYRASGGQLPLVGVGGISTGRDAYEKILAGASAVQLYTGLVFNGMSSVGEILRELDALLEQDGFSSVADAVGANA